MTHKEICDEIAKDAKDDATNFDGKPFNGRTVAEYFGNHGASIATLANIVKDDLIKENEEFKGRISQQQEKLDYLTNRINS